MKIPDKLPELGTMIPKFAGEVYSYMGSLYVCPDNAGPDYAPVHGIIRCGFRLFEILAWSDNGQAWQVREFKATLNSEELMILSEQAPRAKE